MLSDWVLYRLTGRFVTDPSSGSSSNLFDLRTRTWSPASLEIVGLSPEVVPPVLEPGTVVGSPDRTRRRGDGPRGRDAGRRGRRGHAARARRHRRREARPADPRRRQLLAAHGRHRHAAHRPEGAPADAVPRGARPVDDRGHRLLLRDRHALVPGRVLRGRARRGRPAGRRRLRRHGGGGGAGPAGIRGHHRDLLQCHGREALGPGVAVVSGL